MMMMMMMMMTMMLLFLHILTILRQATLKLGGWSNHRMVARVLDILADMELEVCANKLVGCPGRHTHERAQSARVHAVERRYKLLSLIVYARMHMHTNTKRRALTHTKGTHAHAYTHTQ